MLKIDQLNSMQLDKYLHFKYGFILYLFFSLFTKKAMFFVSSIASFKEFLDGLGFGTKEKADYEATVFGAKSAQDFLNEFFTRG